jgi:hypothetical protein
MDSRTYFQEDGWKDYRRRWIEGLSEKGGRRAMKDGLEEDYPRKGK